jgi:mRNA-degrading endonuclease RelE of RelBE toxin-antitoxin system
MNWRTIRALLVVLSYRTLCCPSRMFASTGSSLRSGGLSRIVYAIDEEEIVVDVMAVRQRPPYDYSDLNELIKAIL